MGPEKDRRGSLLTPTGPGGVVGEGGVSNGGLVHRVGSLTKMPNGNEHDEHLRRGDNARSSFNQHHHRRPSAKNGLVDHGHKRPSYHKPMRYGQSQFFFLQEGLKGPVLEERRHGGVRRARILQQRGGQRQHHLQRQVNADQKRIRILILDFFKKIKIVFQPLKKWNMRVFSDLYNNTLNIFQLGITRNVKTLP